MEIINYASKCRDCKIKSDAVNVLDQNEFEILEHGCHQVALSKGEMLLIEGMPPSHIVYYREGFAKVHMKGPSGRDQILKIVKPGAYIGIQTILGDRVNHYSVTTLQPSKACFIDISVFKDLIKKNGSFGYELLVYICQEELNYYHRFVNHGQKQINGRLADALLCFADELYKSKKFNIQLTKSEIAALTGTSRESVTRSFKEFKESRIISTNGREIEILDYDRLKMISMTG